LATVYDKKNRLTAVFLYLNISFFHLNITYLLPCRHKPRPVIVTNAYETKIKIKITVLATDVSAKIIS